MEAGELGEAGRQGGGKTWIWGGRKVGRRRGEDLHPSM